METNYSNSVPTFAGCAPDIVIVDPPRKGLDDAVIAALLKSPGPQRLIYVSCGFNAFKRDANQLLGLSIPATSLVTSPIWRLTHAEGHVLFPGANHLETLAVFDRIKI